MKYEDFEKQMKLFIDIDEKINKICDYIGNSKLFNELNDVFSNNIDIFQNNIKDVDEWVSYYLFEYKEFVFELDNYEYSVKNLLDLYNIITDETRISWNLVV